MKIIGLTGGSGAGKSTVAEIIAGFDAEIIDADVIAREVVEPGKPAIKEIADEWHGVVTDDVLNRAALAKIVFNDERELHKLNTITHKYIIDEINARIKDFKGELFVIDAALLFESGLSDLCDITVSVIAQKEERIKRIIARDNLTRIQAEERINAQKSDDFYITNADFVIYNNKGEEDLKEEIKNIIIRS